MDRFAKIADLLFRGLFFIKAASLRPATLLKRGTDREKSLTISAKCSILDVWQGSGHAAGLMTVKIFLVPYTVNIATLNLPIMLWKENNIVMESIPLTLKWFLHLTFL